MSAYGLQIMDATGAVIFDSTTAIGGVVIDYREYGPTLSATLTYPAYAGHSPFLVHIYPNQATVVLDTSLGYPRVTVSAGAAGPRKFLVMVT